MIWIYIGVTVFTSVFLAFGVFGTEGRTVKLKD